MSMHGITRNVLNIQVTKQKQLTIKIILLNSWLIENFKVANSFSSHLYNDKCIRLDSRDRSYVIQYIKTV